MVDTGGEGMIIDEEDKDEAAELCTMMLKGYSQGKNEEDESERSNRDQSTCAPEVGCLIPSPFGFVCSARK